MAIFGKITMPIISGVALAGAAGSAALIAFTGDDAPKNDADAVAESPASVQQPAVDEIRERADANPAPAAGSGGENGSDQAAGRGGHVNLSFSIGSISDLKAVQLSDLVEKIESVPEVAEDTKVWVATADIASASGPERLFHVKGPLTCGSAGCDLVVVGGQTILLETVGESVDVPETDTLIINKGASTEVTWKFNGAVFVKR